MRWLVVHPGPNFSVADVHIGWCEALRELGEEVVEFNLDDRLTFYETALQELGTDDQGRLQLRKALTRGQAIGQAVNGLLADCYSWWPDVVLGVSAFFLPPPMLDLLRSRGHRVVLIHTESPYQDGAQVLRAAHADLNLVNDPTNLDRFRAQAPSYYLPHAYRPAVHHPGAVDPELAADFAFVGTGYPSRIGFLEAMDFGAAKVLLAGHWQGLEEGSPLRGHLLHDIQNCCDNATTAAVYRSAKVGMNLYRREAESPELSEGWAMGPREVEMAASGLCFLRDPRPEGDTVLDMLPTFTDPADASEQLAWLLAHDDARQRAADAARAAVAERTFRNHAAWLLRLLDRQSVTA